MRETEAAAVAAAAAQTSPNDSDTAQAQFEAQAPVVAEQDAAQRSRTARGAQAGVDGALAARLRNVETLKALRAEVFGVHEALKDALGRQFDRLVACEEAAVVREDAREDARQEACTERLDS